MLRAAAARDGVVRRLDRAAERLQRRHGQHAARSRPRRRPGRQRDDRRGDQQLRAHQVERHIAELQHPARQPHSAGGERRPADEAERTRRSRRRRDPDAPISDRCDRAEAPMSRISAMRRVRPATTVAKVFAVTIDATYTATPRRSAVRTPLTNAEHAAGCRCTGRRSASRRCRPVAEMSSTPNAVEIAATRMLAPIPRSRSHASGADAAAPRRPHAGASRVAAVMRAPRAASGAVGPELGREHVRRRSPRRSAGACRRRSCRRRGRSPGRRGWPRSGRASPSRSTGRGRGSRRRAGRAPRGRCASRGCRSARRRRRGRARSRARARSRRAAAARR